MPRGIPQLRQIRLEFLGLDFYVCYVGILLKEHGKIIRDTDLSSDKESPEHKSLLVFNNVSFLEFSS